MKINLKIFAMLLAASMLAITSCQQDKEPEPLTTEEAEAVLTTMGAEMETMMEEVMTTPAVGSLMNFSTLMNMDSESPALKQLSLFSDLLNQDYAKDASRIEKTMSKVKSFVTAEEEEGDMLETKGTFTWSFQYSRWTYSPEPTDKLVFEFPSNPEQTTTNAILTISNYTKLVVGEEMFPQSLSIDLVVNDLEVLSFDYTADVTPTALNSMNIDLMMSDFELSAGLTITSDASSSVVQVEHNMMKTGVTLNSSNVELSIDGMSGINPFDMNNEEDLIPTQAKGFVQTGQVKAELDVAILAMENAYNTSTSTAELVEAANQNINISFFTFPEGAKMGKIVWKWSSSEGDIVPYFQFNDGTEKPLQDVIGVDFDF
jgi:hypothetical protein